VKVTAEAYWVELAVYVALSPEGETLPTLGCESMTMLLAGPPVSVSGIAVAPVL
jgi:hypothetical protein